ncbi:MAG: hypothetical protein IPM70_18940 [Proteobacteria bacterium]|nr:hypothetical protein [Pseudomonadota bacterium]
MQIKDYEKRLTESEGRLAAFKKQNVGLVPGQEQSDFFSRLQNEITASKRAETSLELATRRRAELSRQLRSEQPYAAGGGVVTGRRPAGGNDTSSRIAETQARLDELLLRFTDKHPDVVSTRQALLELQARQQQELDAFRRGDTAAIAMSGLLPTRSIRAFRCNSTRPTSKSQHFVGSWLITGASRPTFAAC